eukprot:6969608-Alexandrium_andersonii.AAC.1
MSTLTAAKRFPSARARPAPLAWGATPRPAGVGHDDAEAHSTREEVLLVDGGRLAADDGQQRESDA